MNAEDKLFLLGMAIGIAFGVTTGLILYEKFGNLRTERPAKIEYHIDVIDGEVDTTFIYKHP